MKNKIFKGLLILIVCLMLVGCEKKNNDEKPTPEPKEQEIILDVNTVEGYLSQFGFSDKKLLPDFAKHPALARDTIYFEGVDSEEEFVNWRNNVYEYVNSVTNNVIISDDNTSCSANANNIELTISPMRMNENWALMVKEEYSE